MYKVKINHEYDILYTKKSVDTHGFELSIQYVNNKM